MILSAQQNTQAVYAQPKASQAVVTAPKNEVPGEVFSQAPAQEDLGLMPKPQAQAPQEETNAIAAGALYGTLAGAGVAVVLGAATFGVGLVTGIATIPAGLAIGTLIGCGVEAFK